MKICFGERKCLVCSKDFPETSRCDTIYCSVHCANKSRNKKYRDLNKEKIKLKNHIDNSNTERRILSRLKSRCKINNVKFDLELSDIVVPEYCPVLGTKLNLRHGSRGYHPDAPSVDRINPKKGYTKENIRIISGRANLLKNNAEIWELQLVLEDLKRLC